MTSSGQVLTSVVSMYLEKYVFITVTTIVFDHALPLAFRPQQSVHGREESPILSSYMTRATFGAAISQAS